MNLAILARILLTLTCLATCSCYRAVHADRYRLLDGIGAVHHSIATFHPETQEFFDQGLALVYASNFGEAVNSFRHAAELDPNTAMPYWGIALAHGPTYDHPLLAPDQERAAFDAIHTAVHLAAKAPSSERAFVDALTHCFTDKPKPDQSALARDCSDAMREVYNRYPDDPDAAALFAASLMNRDSWRLWTAEGDPAADTGEVVAVLEQSLRRWPDHTGLHQFYVLAMEASPYPERALASALRLPLLAPSAGGLLQLSSRIFFRTGDYATAVRTSQDAIIAGHQDQDRHPVPPRRDLALAAAMQGDFETARNAAPPDAPFVLLRFARWDDILAASSARPNLAFWHMARAIALAAKHQFTQATDEEKTMQQAFRSDKSAIPILAAQVVAARIAQAQGDGSVAIRHWRDAVATQDQLNLDAWYYPTRESLGAVLLLDGRAAEAELVFREDLERTPRNPRSLYGLSRSLQLQQKSYQANCVRQSFQSAWKGREQPNLEDY